MICPYCGKENVDRAPFCADCGKSLAGTYEENVKAEMVSETSTEVNAVNSVIVDSGVHVPSQSESVSTAASPSVESVAQTESVSCVQTPQPAAQPAVQSATQPASSAAQAAPQAAVQSEPQQASQTTAQAAAQIGAQYQQVPPTQPSQTASQTMPQGVPYGVTAKPVYAQGCMGAAWKDMTSSEGWFKKVLLLGLIMCVPILNFYVYGYCMRWARQLVLGKIEPMPKKIFEEGNFSQGFYALVWTLVVGLVVGIAGAIVGWVPFLGFLVTICLSLFTTMFSMMGVMRLAISKNLGRAFDIKEDWRGFTKNFGSLFGAAVVPNLIIGAIIILLMMIVMFVIFGFAFQAGLGAGAYASGYYSTSYFLQILASLFVMLPLFLVIAYICGVLYAVAYLWTYRAVGHYVARELPEWNAIVPQYEQ